MHYRLSTMAIALAAFQTAFSFAVVPRAANKYSTITNTIVTSTVTKISTTIDSDIEATGVNTLIPGALTINFKNLPAYIYLETEIKTTIYTTLYQTTVVKASASATLAPISTAKPNTTAATSNYPSSSTSQTSTAPSSTIKPTTTTTKATSTNTVAVTTPIVVHTKSENCNVQGSNNGMTVAITSHKDTAIECEDMAQIYTYIRTFSWSGIDETCLLYSDAYSVTEGNTGVFFSMKQDDANNVRNDCYS